MLRNVEDRRIDHQNISKSSQDKIPSTPQVPAAPPERWKPSTSRCWIWWVCHGLSIGLSAQRKDGIPDPCVEDLSHVLSHPLVLPRDLSHAHTVPDRWLLEFPWVSIFLCMFVVGCSWRENPSNPFALFRTPLESPSDLQLCFSWDRSRSSLHGRQLLQCELLVRGAAWGSISGGLMIDGGYVGEWNLQASFNYILTWYYMNPWAHVFDLLDAMNKSIYIYIIDMNPIRVPEFPCLEICRSSIIRSIPGIQKKSLKRFRTHSQRERCSLVKHSLIVSSRNSWISCWLVLIIDDY